MIFSAIAKEVDRFKSIIFRIVKFYCDTDSFQSPKTPKKPHKMIPWQNQVTLPGV